MNSLIEINNIKKAMEQYRKEEEEYREYIRTSSQELVECAGLFLDMRGKLTSFQKFMVEGVLSDNAPGNAGLGWVGTILDGQEFMNLPSAMVSLLHDISYNILDDGMMGIAQIKVFDNIEEWARENNLKLAGPANREVVAYAVWTGEYWDGRDGTIGKNYVRKHDHCFRMPYVRSCRSVHLTKLEQFIGILKTVDDPSNYDERDNLRNGVLDFLFK